MAGPSASSPHVEILAHVTAPSRAAHDALYRQLAHAYLAFEPVSRTPVIVAHEDSRASPAAVQPSGSTNAPVPEASSLAAAAAAGWIGSFDSQDLSFRSAWDNCASARQWPLAPASCEARRQSRADQGEGAEEPAPFCPPASQVSDSYPMPEAGVLTFTPTRILEPYLRSSDQRPDIETGSGSSITTSVATSSPPPPDATRGSFAVVIPSSILEADGQPSPSARHVVPETPVVALTGDRNDAAELATTDFLDVTHISSSFLSQEAPSSPPAPASPLSRKRRRITSPDATEPPTAEEVPAPDSSALAAAIAPNSSMVIAAAAAAVAAAPSSPSPAPSYRGSDSSSSRSRKSSKSDSPPVPWQDEDALEIVPPSPPATTDEIDLSSLVSDKLAKLAHDLSSRYRPEAPLRVLDPLERGYWLLDCAGWPQQARHDAWVFLTNYLGSGLAGWGVWCRRGATAEAAEPERAWIRLYCWAHVLKHTYLLLYLASGRCVKATGATWYGADGKPAVVVAPAGERRP